MNNQAFASCIINYITMGKIHFESLNLDLKIRTCKFAFYARSLNTRLLTRRSSFQGLQPISLVINQLRWSCSYLTTDLIFYYIHYLYDLLTNHPSLNITTIPHHHPSLPSGTGPLPSAAIYWDFFLVFKSRLALWHCLWQLKCWHCSGANIWGSTRSPLGGSQRCPGPGGGLNTHPTGKQRTREPKQLSEWVLCMHNV